MTIARILGEVGLVHLPGAREGLSVGTRFAIPAFSHSLSLMLIRRVAAQVPLESPAAKS
jgi:hypothetical protein